jgi:hypothetical protein
MQPRYLQPYVLLDFQRVFTGEPLMSEIARRAAVTRRARSRQIALPLPKSAQKREATSPELVELLVRLPAHADRLQQRRSLRAIRTGLERGLVAADASTLHATADGRTWLEVVSAPSEDN